MRAAKPAAAHLPIRLALVSQNSLVLSRPTQRMSHKAIRASRPMLQEMYTVMRKANGMGLSAPQVGLSHSLSIVECLADPHLPNLQELPFRALFNPAITASSGRQEVWEGCLSVPGMMGLVPRAEDVTVTFFDEEARPARLRATGYLAALFQHELDHLNGRLYTQRLLAADKFVTEAEWNRHNPPNMWNIKGSWQMLPPS